MKGALKKVEGMFRCRRCVCGVVVDSGVREEMSGGVERVEGFVYLGDKLNAGGGCMSAVTARVRVGWMKFQELCGVLCGRKWSIGMNGKVYVGGTWVMKKEEECMLQRAERAMVRKICGLS